ncbi:DUF3306 domain-containing protein [Chromohalobacter canadensis]|uniref:DUF3306 domain-containing protein n=1 Tax=Chromohalobacter canadensis TaxID=141389 RepID=UPI0021BEE880|nr:DUF3306 domain-containing protein [Chromohalobacter canadensis]MCT8469737.1 DUF3306 domain-containing protein [Chromohalobacter canadensis]MCT8472428.1 DUF3306 domain-containing protein [Chromohalobacter canadensis]MCT8499459.1 DUF3306 domain-containing protein [Chromohalobacter canadensis]
MSFMQRWSQRKRDHGDASSLETLSEETPTTSPEQTHASSPNEENATSSRAAALIPGYDPERPLDEQLPDPDALGAGDDFRAFMLPGVGEFLKRRALRRMFKVGNYNVRDGLDDYDDDYSQLTQMAPETGERMRQWLRQERDKILEPAQDGDTPDQAEVAQATEEDDPTASPAPVASSEDKLSNAEKAPNDTQDRSGAST